MSFSRSLVTILVCSGTGLTYGQSSSLQLNVIEGEGAINNIRTHTGHDPLVEVREQSGAPIAGASVTFQLPGSGPGGMFAGAESSLVTQTDEHGQAVGRGRVGPGDGFGWHAGD